MPRPIWTWEQGGVGDHAWYAARLGAKSFFRYIYLDEVYMLARDRHTQVLMVTFFDGVDALCEAMAFTEDGHLIQAAYEERTGQS